MGIDTSSPPSQSHAQAPPAGTSALAKIAISLLVLVVYWVLSASIAATFSTEESFTKSLLHPDPHEIVDLVLVVQLALAFLCYHDKKTRERDSLQKSLRDALATAEDEREKVKAIIDAMGDAISVQDTELNVLYQNRAHQDLIGPHVGERCYRAYRGREDVCTDCHLVQAFEDGNVHRLERCYKANRWVEIIGSSIKDHSGRIIAGIEVVRDVTDLKVAEQSSKKEAALLQHLIDTIPNPIYYQDLSGRFVWCNTAFAAWLRKGRELLVGRTISEVAQEPVSRVFAIKEPAGDRVVIYEASLQRNGEPRDVIFYKSMFDAPDGSGGTVGVIVDITERKRFEQEIVGLNAALTQQALEMQQANRELEAFSHAISHDLRTPLTKIYTSGQGLLDYQEAFDENGLFFVKSINDGCLQIEGLLDALLVLSRVTEVGLIHDQVDLTQMAHEKAAQLRQTQPERQVAFKIAPKLQVRGDHHLLHIAMENLLANAWKYTSQSGDTVIEVGSFISSEGETIYFVKDNGAGFDSVHADQLFKPFRRLHSTQQFPGTGLGLATVRRIIRRHGGRVWGEGRPGCGATFYFTLSP